VFINLVGCGECGIGALGEIGLAGGLGGENRCIIRVHGAFLAGLGHVAQAVGLEAFVLGLGGGSAGAVHGLFIASADAILTSPAEGLKGR